MAVAVAAAARLATAAASVANLPLAAARGGVADRNVWSCRKIVALHCKHSIETENISPSV